VPQSSWEFASTRFWLANPTQLPHNAWEIPRPEPVSALIKDIDEQNIVCMVDGSSTPTKLPSARLQAIDVAWGTQSAVAAHAAYMNDDFLKAIELAKKTIAEGNLPRWQQKILAAEITDSLIGLGQTSSGCRVFISLCRESPAPLLYESAPLNWTSQRGSTELDQLAREWMQPERAPIERLLGASWLLRSTESAAAQSWLEQLSRSKTPVISELATAQFWRVELPNRVADRYQEWSTFRDRMLLPLQVGPTITIADKLERAGHAEKALQEWLRIIALHPAHRSEVRNARDSAGALLAKLGRADEARKLLGNAIPGQ
jgi:hypothetical protein